MKTTAPTGLGTTLNTRKPDTQGVNDPMPMTTTLLNMGTVTVAPQFLHSIFLNGPSHNFCQTKINGESQLGHLCLFMALLT